MRLPWANFLAGPKKRQSQFALWKPLFSQSPKGEAKNRKMKKSQTRKVAVSGFGGG
jgi:hypothetical protein